MFSKLYKVTIKNLQLVFLASAVLCMHLGTAEAQQLITHPNASPCPGNCAPGRPYGWVQPRWRQWPGVVYPGTIVPTPAGEEASPSRVELPNPNKESEIQSQQMQPAPRGTSKSSGEALPSDTTPDSGELSTPIKPLDESGGLPPSGNLPGAMPQSDQPSFGPTTPMEPGKITPPPGSGSSVTPNSRTRFAAAESNSAAVGSSVNAANPRNRWTSADANDPQLWRSTRFRSSKVDLARYTQPDDESEFNLPTLKTRSADPTSQDLASIRGANPLRYDSTGRILRTNAAPPAATLSASDRAASDSNQPDDSNSNSSVFRENPLRRN